MLCFNPVPVVEREIILIEGCPGKFPFSQLYPMELRESREVWGHFIDPN
jgi:hypothetical protein